MNVCSHLVVEWSEDLALLAACDEEELAALKQPRKPPSSSVLPRLGVDTGNDSDDSTSSSGQGLNIASKKDINSSSSSNSEDLKPIIRAQGRAVEIPPKAAGGGRGQQEESVRVDGVVRGWPPDSTPLRRCSIYYTSNKSIGNQSYVACLYLTPCNARS